MNSLTKRLEPESLESSQMPFMGLFVFAAVLLGIILYAIPFFLHTFVFFQGDVLNQITLSIYPIL
jgi:hypothetical protein